MGARYFSYYEYAHGNTWLDRETGTLPLLGASVRADLNPRWALLGSWQGAFGKVSYDGQLWNGAPYQTDTRIAENLLQGGVGWQLPHARSRLIWQLGYYQRNRDILSHNGVSGVEETYHWLQTGLAFQHPLTSKALLTLGLDWALAPRLQTGLPNAAVIDLPSFPRYHLGLAWTLWQHKAHKLLLKGDLRYSEHRVSEVVPSSLGPIREPAASLGELDMSLGWTF